MNKLFNFTRVKTSANQKLIDLLISPSYWQLNFDLIWYSLHEVSVTLYFPPHNGQKISSDVYTFGPPDLTTVCSKQPYQ